MGNEQSSADVAEAVEAIEQDDGAAHYDSESEGRDAAVDAGAFGGFRVLGIQEQSPAARVGFVSFFDFIMAANGIRLDTRDSTFMELIAQSEERPMQLDVYNLKSQTTRQLTLTPSRKWPGKGLLGVTIRFDSYEHAEDQLLHVLDVVDKSPAAEAGLRAGSDYLLGTPERVFRDPDDLHEVILDALNDSFQCYVYNADEDQVRIVRIAPSDRWGGGGVLGAEVGHGVLHRLPAACHETIGTSVGFVSLSEEAKAATDPYLRQLPSSEEPPAPEQASEDAIAPSEATAEEKRTGVESVRSEAEEKVEATVEEVSPSTEHNESQAEATEPSPSTVPAPPCKPRYAARIDPRFPMSTIEVLADPTQLG